MAKKTAMNPSESGGAAAPPPGEPLCILAGPTGAGKSALAIALARRLRGAVISADSMQVYRGLAIGTAQPTGPETREIPHFLIGFLDPRERFDAARFTAAAEDAEARARAAGRLPMIVGGTGLYLRALVEGLFEGPSRDAGTRRRLEAEARERGDEALHARLARVDPAAAARIGPRDRVRIVRALETFEVTGRPISALWAEGRRGGARRAARYVIVTRDRAELYDRINRRAEAMLAAGWVEEVRGLLAAGVPEDAPCFRALGYGEVLRHLRGEFGREALADAIQRASRHYARRQLVWFRAVREAVWVNLSALSEEAACEEVARAWGRGWPPAPPASG